MLEVLPSQKGDLEAPILGYGGGMVGLDLLQEHGWSPHLEALLNPTHPIPTHRVCSVRTHPCVFPLVGLGLTVGNEGLGCTYHPSLPL